MIELSMDYLYVIFPGCMKQEMASIKLMTPILFLAFISDMTCILLNTFLAYALWKLKKLQILSYKFILGLCLADTVVGLNGLVYHVLMVVYWNKNNELLSTGKAVVRPFVEFSSRFIFIIAIDRAIRMRYLTRYDTVMTNKRAIVIVFGSLLICVFGIIVGVIKSLVVVAQYFHMILTIINGIGLILCCGIYVYTYLSIRNTIQSLCVHSGRNSFKTEQPRRRPDQDFAKAVLFVMTTILVCYTPILSLHITFFFVIKTEILSYLEAWFELIVIFSSSLDAIILIAFNYDVRNYAKNVWGTLRTR